MSLHETGQKPEGGADDILSMATRALRDQCDRRDPNAGARINPATTRSRVMMSLRQQERRRTAAVYILLPAAAVLVASTAWAAANGRLPTVMKTLGEKLGFVQAPATSMPAPQPLPATDVKAHAATSVAEEAPAPPSTEAAVTAPAEMPATPPKPHASVSPSPSARPFDERGEKLYEAAHRAHFTDRNWSAALAAWDRYLAASPHGRFVPEARYNRAIALLRLDRRDEAVRELTPFAEGKYGGYRQEEARGLIEAMQK
ncbi:hypothetical protein LVJ94_44120 [Pendulispora rubella]|uniref:Tetratricopeptide repeat protein n=1 Tax=Pendulispora rubella TaxID=2741070 RepID=A0ABZ2L5I3_9BACT